MSKRPGPVSRRAVLGAAVAAAGLAALPAAPASAAVTPPAGPFPALPPLPPGAPVRGLFAPLEQRFAGYLAILPGMTNDIEVVDPATIGYMDGGWWRTPSIPTNARVQEHVFTLSWFHANARAWNPYAGSTALRNRLEAAIVHYLDLQHVDGSFPEYTVTEESKAATGFGLNYLAKTLANLRRANALPARRTQIDAALHTGMTWFLNPANAIWNAPVVFANQNAAGLSASTVALALTPDSTLQSQLRDRIDYLAAHGQSPAGFFYEPTGMDIDYNFEVMLPEIAEIYRLTGNQTVLSMARKFTDWFGYNVVREPDGSGSLTYVAMSARTTVTGYDNVVPDPDRTNLASFFVPAIPNLAAFYTTAEDRAATRAAWAAAAGPAPGLAKQDTSPRIIAHAPYGEALPCKATKAAAIAQLPYIRSTDFAVQRRDTALNQIYTYVRRPLLYLAGFFGTRPSSEVRSSPGLLWHPVAGTVIQSQQIDTQCWASLLPNGNADAHSDLDATFLVGGQSWNGQPVAPGSAPVTVNYQLPDGRIKTTLTIMPNSVTRAVQGTSALTEQIPLVLKPSDQVAFTNGTPVTYGQNASATATGLTLRRGSVLISISWGPALASTVEATAVTMLTTGGRRLHVLRIPHGGTLTTVIRMQ